MSDSVIFPPAIFLSATLPSYYHLRRFSAQCSPCIARGAQTESYNHNLIQSPILLITSLWPRNGDSPPANAANLRRSDGCPKPRLDPLLNLNNRPNERLQRLLLLRPPLLRSQKRSKILYLPKSRMEKLSPPCLLRSRGTSRRRSTSPSRKGANSPPGRCSRTRSSQGAFQLTDFV